ncbi:MAG: hypothetical protein PHC68_17875 [Syntrophorhabdaceae bacterium]|nr:hypothetical protein [Syntrophorhabdaceae bacterium]
MSMCKWCRKSGGCIQPEGHLKAVETGELYCDYFKPILMPRISMAWTTPAWVAEQKCVTRRHWKPLTISRFHKGTKYLTVKSNYGGDALGIGEIIVQPFKEQTSRMNNIDYEHEGFAFMDKEYYRIKKDMPLNLAMANWKRRNEIMTVVPFNILEVFPGMKEKYTTDDEIARCVKALVRAIG